MSESQPPAPTPQPVPVLAAKPSASSWKYTLGLIVALVAVAGGVYAYITYTTPIPTPVDELSSLKTYIEKLGNAQKLAEGYTDADADLVADAPTNPAAFLKVDEIGFTAVGTDVPETAQVRWKDLMASLAQTTGKNVKYVADVGTFDDQLKALREGRLHVTACSMGQVPTAVNTAGLVPLFCIADKDGKYAYEMEILVRADSRANSAADLKGKKIGLTSLSSNSGGKAPLVLLKEKFGLLPGRDYKYTFTGDHIRSVRELVASNTDRFDAVCVANDQLAGAYGDQLLKPEQVKSIFKSESFPPLCFGVPHNLPPDLAAKIRQTFASFSFVGNSVGEYYKAQGKTKFAPVDYKKDWKLIREVDDSLTRLLDGK